METATFECSSSEVFHHVYEPSEDTFLLLDALEKDLELLNILRPKVIVEVGCGSGVVISSLAKSLRSQALCLATDINPHAALMTINTAKRNGVQLDVVLTDLVDVFESRLHKTVDLLIFNPPYVVTHSEEVSGNDLQASWAGGAKGREVIDRLLPSAPNLLTPGGLFYLVVIKENDQAEIAQLMGDYGLEMTVVLARRAGPEHLFVLRFSFQSYP